MLTTTCLLLAQAGFISAAIAQTPASVPTATTEPAPYTEPLRPLVHFTAKKNWLNDPNGLVYYDDEYHLFFQHNPNGIEWGDMTWGHAVSRDLVHWTQLDNALAPDALGTIYSGSAAVDWTNSTGFSKNGRPPLVAMYTAAGGKSEASKGKPFTQCLAFSTDTGRTWTKFEGNPVIPHIAAENRDPKIIWYPPTKRWIAALYEDGSRFSLHESPDLKHWAKLQDIEMSGCSECPDFFPLALDGDEKKIRWVFTAADARYLVGTFDGRMFKPEGGVKQTDFGRNFYAVQTFSDARTNMPHRLQIAWMRGPRPKDMPFNQQMSFPTEIRLLTAADGPRLRRQPAAEIKKLHDEARAVRGVCTKTGPGGDDGWLSNVKGEALYITAEFEPGAAKEFGLVIFGQLIHYTVADKTLHALGDAQVDIEYGSLSLELIVDRGSIETFAQRGRVAMASCFEPKSDAPPVSVFINGEGAKAMICVYPLKSMWAQDTHNSK